jgi:hypothetical protein
MKKRSSASKITLKNASPSRQQVLNEASVNLQGPSVLDNKGWEQNPLHELDPSYDVSINKAVSLFFTIKFIIANTLA